MIRIYNSRGVGSGGGGVGDLQAVTTVGNITNNPIIVTGGADFTQIDADVIIWNQGANFIQETPEILTNSWNHFKPDAGGMHQVSGNGLLLPQKTIAAGAPYHPVRADHVIEVNLTAGGTKDVELDNALYAFPGLQVVIKVISFGGASPTLKIFATSGTIDGQANIKYRCINLFAVRLVNNGTNWFVLDTMTGAEIVSELAPTVTNLLARGGIATITAASSDNVGLISMNFGASVADGTPFMRVNFARAWPVAPRGVFLQATGCDKIGSVTAYYAVLVPVATITAASFTLVTPNDGTNSLALTTCTWMYTVVQ